MKYTVLQLRHGRWLPVREYYQFPIRQCQKITGTGGTKARYQCPGCLKQMTEIYVTDHECFGGTERWPKIDLMKYKQNQRWRPTSTFKPIQFKASERKTTPSPQ